MYCGKCGAQNDEQAKFCKVCGTPMHTVNKTNQIKSVQKKKRSKKKLWILVTVLIFLIASILAIIPIMKDVKAKKDYENYISTGQRYLEEINYEKAEIAYLKAIKIVPKNAEPYLKLADIYIAQEEYDKAKDILKQAQEAGVSDQSTHNDNTIISDKLEELEDLWEYIWVVEPKIEADNIYYINENNVYDNAVNHMHKQMEKDYNYAVIHKGNKFDLIDMDGNTLNNIELVAVTSSLGMYEVEYDREITFIDVKSKTCRFVGDGFVPPFGRGDTYGATGGVYYWKNGLKKQLRVEENGGMDMPDPVCAIPIQEATADFNSEWSGVFDGKYGIYCNGQLVKDFIYDECGSCSDGLLAVCKDGKWGYVNEQGKVIIPLEYDASWKEYVPFANTENGKVQDYCYAASENTVVLCKKGKWELRDNKGTLIVPPSVFEEIRPMHSGRCWVKKDGKWGVIQLNPRNNNIADENTEDEKDTNISLNYLEIYEPILQEIFNKSGEYAEYNTYFLYDIDKNDVKELVALQGTCNADFMYQIYTIENGHAKYLGEVSGFSCSFYMDESGGKEKYIIRSEGHMGYARVERIAIENERITTKEIYSGETEDYYSNPYPIKEVPIMDMSLLELENISSN